MCPGFVHRRVLFLLQELINDAQGGTSMGRRALSALTGLRASAPTTVPPPGVVYAPAPASANNFSRPHMGTYALHQHNVTPIRELSPWKIQYYTASIVSLRTYALVFHLMPPIDSATDCSFNAAGRFNGPDTSQYLLVARGHWYDLILYRRLLSYTHITHAGSSDT